MKKLAPYMAILLSLSTTVFAADPPEVTEGDGAETLYQANKDKALVISQINKTFVLQGADAKDAGQPPDISMSVGSFFFIRAGSFFFIRNDETDTVHNVYDLTDQSWVLKKQRPGSIAAVKFSEPGVHVLRCAIHPQMKMLVKVTPAAEKKN